MEIFENKSSQSPRCINCGKEFSGRRDKKFCCDQCRSTHHNDKKLKEEKWIHNINRILRKNRTVLKTMNPTGHSTIRIQHLKEKGFDDRFYTHQYKTAKGELYYFCYEYGYQVISAEKALVVNWQNYMKPFESCTEPKH